MMDDYEITIEQVFPCWRSAEERITAYKRQRQPPLHKYLDMTARLVGDWTPKDEGTDE